MAIRYFKCHTLPYPSYGLAASTTLPQSVDLSWTNGPPGQSVGTTHIEYATIADTATTTVTTAGGTVESRKLIILAVVPTEYRFRIRRENSAGFGEWTSYVTATVMPES